MVMAKAVVEKQTTGFRFGKYRTTVIRECGQLTVHGRIYKLVLLETSDGHRYLAWRLYNGQGKFIKQFLFEPWILNGLIDIMIEEANR